MVRTPVKSSNIKSIGYDPSSKTLEVEFSAGTVYEFPGVSADVWAAFQSAGSAGRFFASEIKGKYTGSKKVEAGKEAP